MSDDLGINKSVRKPRIAKYSGDKSKEFWHRINAVRGVRGEMLYGMGVMLQNLEGTFHSAEWNVLRELQEAEDKVKKQ